MMSHYNNRICDVAHEIRDRNDAKALTQLHIWRSSGGVVLGEMFCNKLCQMRFGSLLKVEELFTFNVKVSVVLFIINERR